MHPDFKRIASLRKFLMRGDARTAPNYGRDLAATWIARHANPVPAGVMVEELPANSGRTITPASAQPDAIMIYIHGGGLVYYDTDVFTPFLAQLSQQTGMKIVALDYPKAPETSGLKILEILETRVRKILADAPHVHVTMAGDSVGGLLAVQLCTKIKSQQIKNLQLIYPVVDDQIALDCAYGTDHFLDSTMMTWFYDFIGPICDQKTAPCAMSPAQLQGLPPTTIHIAGADILAAQGQRFTTLLSKANRLKNCITYPELPHDFCLYAGTSDSAAQAIQQIANSMKDLVDA